MGFIRQQPCAVTLSSPCDPHHAITGGKSVKATDLSSVPLVHSLHAELHSKGKKTFQAEHNIDMKDAMILNLMKYICLLEGNDPEEYA